MIFEVLIFVCILEEFFLLFKAAIALIFFLISKRRKISTFKMLTAGYLCPLLGVGRRGG